VQLSEINPWHAMTMLYISTAVEKTKKKVMKHNRVKIEAKR